MICRLQSHHSDNEEWVQIPISFVGKTQLSHIDIEPQLNFIFHYDRFHSWVTGGVGYSVGPIVTSDAGERDLGWKRVKIGDTIPFEFSVRYSLSVDRELIQVDFYRGDSQSTYA